MVAVLIALLSSVFWGGSDVLGGLAARTSTVLRTTLWVYLGATATVLLSLPLVSGQWSGLLLTVGLVAGVTNVLGRRVQIPEHIVTALRQMLVRQFDDLHTANKAERHTLAVERDQLRDERRSLLHAHHAGAVPLDLLKEEQDRIGRRLAFLDAQIDACQIE